MAHRRYAGGEPLGIYVVKGRNVRRKERREPALKQRVKAGEA